jgi:hypothetical protein
VTLVGKGTVLLDTDGPQGRGHLRFRSPWKNSQEKPGPDKATPDQTFSPGVGYDNHTGEPINRSVPILVDTADIQLNYQGGTSTIYSSYEVKAPRHVDVRPRTSRHEVSTSMAQLRPLKWDRDKALLASEQFFKSFEPSDVTEWPEVQVHLALCLERTRFFHSRYNKLPMSPELLVWRSLSGGPSFNDLWASWWKDSRFKWCNTIRNMPIDLSDCPFEFNGYNSVFPPFFLIFWGEEPEDYKWQQGDKPTVDPEVLLEIEKIVSDMSQDLLPDGDFSTPDHVIYAPTSSNAFDGESETNPEWLFEYNNPDGDYEDDTLVFARGYALKRPSESRDIGTLTPQSLRLHRRIMFPLQKACRRIKGCVYGKPLPFIKKVVRDLGDSARFFYMRDYVKSGMTIPHEVVDAVFRGFFKRDPAAYKRASRAFLRSRVHIEQDGNWTSFHPVTGFPLGMFVEGYTLLQYAMNKYLCETIGRNVRFNGNNDDMIAGSRDFETIELYARNDNILQEDLGMSVKGTKTGISEDRFIYCEEYWNGEEIEPKDCLFSLAILGAAFAINIVHAKELVGSVLMTSPDITKNVKKAVAYVQEKFIPEFSDQEFQWPLLFGGWWPCKQDGLDCSLLWRNGDCIADFAYWCSRIKHKSNSQLNDTATMAFSRKYHMELLNKPTNPSIWLSLKPLFGKKKCLKDYYSLISRAPREIKRKYHHLYLARRKMFNDFVTGKKECPSVLYGYIRRHPNTIIIPGMDGVVYSRVGNVIRRPRLGLNMSGVMGILSSMVHQGYISCDLPRKITGSEKQLHTLGITEEMKYGHVPMSDQGLPLSAMQFHMPGLYDLWASHGLYVVRIDDNDDPYELSKHWQYLPLPLVWLIRIRTVRSRAPPTDAVPLVNEDTALWWFKAVTGQQIGYDHDWDRYIDEDYEEPEVDDSDFLEFLKRLLDSVNLSDFKAKVIPWPKDKDRSFNGDEPVVIDGVLHYQTSGGSWLPVTSDEPSSSFWDNQEDDEEIVEYFWD